MSLFYKAGLGIEVRSPHPGLHQIRVRLKDPARNETVLFEATIGLAGFRSDAARRVLPRSFSVVGRGENPHPNFANARN